MKKNNGLTITVLTHSYPSDHFPVSGIFVKDQVEYLSKLVKVKIIAPKPRSNVLLSLLKEKWKKYHEISAHQSFDSYELFRPDYVTYPRRMFFKKIGKNFWRSVEDHLDKDTDIFHIHFAYPGGSIVTKLKKKYPDKKVFISVHGNDWHKSKDDRRIKKIIKKNFLNADKILTVSKSLKEDILAYYPDLGEKVKVLHNGVNVDILKLNNLEDPYSSRSKIRVLMIGAFVEGKGIHVLLRALQALESTNHEVIIIGNLIDPKSYKYLEQLKDELALSEQVKFILSLPREKVYKYIKNCDYFILPSLKEGFGIALIEALMFGKPVISTYSGGPEEIVNEDNGILVKPGNVEELKEAIKKMDSMYKEFDPNKLSMDIIKKFDMRNIIDKLINEYEISLK